MVKSIQMPAYDDFAWFYNRYWSQEFHSAAFPVLERIWLPRLAGGARVLDVCCGTGYLAGLLVERGFRVTGIDESAPMVDFARQNVPSAEFHVARASEFKVPGRFDAAVSTFDSLNHLIGVESLEAAFQRTAAALRSGASFAFDILGEEAYQTDWGQNFALVRDDHVLLISGSAYDFRSRVARCTVTMFRLMHGVWQRSDVVVEEQAYRACEIDGALDRAGFGGTVCYDARDLGMAGQLGEGRTFYVATRL
jgi:SAM-dependent methyltransferase